MFTWKTKSVTFFLSCVFLVMVSSILYAGVIKADIIKNEVIRYVLATAENENFEFEVIVPSAYDIEVDAIVNPEITVSHDPGRISSDSIPVTVDIRNDKGEVVRKVRLFARLKSYATVAVAGREIKRDEAIGSGDIEMKRVEVTRLKEYYTSLSGLNGTQAKRTIKAGTVLTGSLIRPVFVVKRGDTVNIEIRNGAMTIRTTGIARENGGCGETIKVFVDMSKTVVTGEIVDDGTVVISGV